MAKQTEGNIRIALDDEDDRVAVDVQDDGVGVNEGFDLRKNAGLGLQIVRTLVEKDLRGEIALTNSNGHTGTHVAFNFHI